MCIHSIFDGKSTSLEYQQMSLHMALCGVLSSYTTQMESAVVHRSYAQPIKPFCSHIHVIIALDWHCYLPVLYHQLASAQASCMSRHLALFYMHVYIYIYIYFPLLGGC